MGYGPGRKRSKRPISKVYNIMIQARGLEELMGFTKVSLKA